MAQTLTTENVIAWAARPEYVTSFTNDKTVLNIVTHFLQWFKKEIISSENTKHSLQNGTIQSYTFNINIKYNGLTSITDIFIDITINLQIFNAECQNLNGISFTYLQS